MADPLAPPFSGILHELHRRQNSWNASHCLPGTITSLPDCDKLDQILPRCSELANQHAPKQEVMDCYCTQEVLNTYVGCKNDMRLCGLSYELDAEFDKLINDWQDTCQPYLTSTITTPAGTSLTATYDEQSCQTAAIKCKQLDDTYSSCSSAYTRAADLSTCRCGSGVLVLASECESAGGACQRSSLGPSFDWSALYCAMAPVTTSDSPGITSSTPLTTNTGTVTSMTSISPISFGPTSSSTTTSAGDRSLDAPWLLLIFAWGITTWCVR